MGTLDIILLICFIPALVRGIQKGLVEQLVSIISILLGTWLAFRLSLPVGEWLSGYLTMEPKSLQLIAFILVAIVAVLVLSLIGKLITHTLKLASLGWLNRLLGVIFALFKAALVIGLLIFIFESVNAKLGLIKPDTMGESPVYIALRDAAMKVFPYLQSLISNA